MRFDVCVGLMLIAALLVWLVIPTKFHVVVERPPAKIDTLTLPQYPCMPYCLPK